MQQTKQTGQILGWLLEKSQKCTEQSNSHWMESYTLQLIYLCYFKISHWKPVKSMKAQTDAEMHYFLLYIWPQWTAPQQQRNSGDDTSWIVIPCQSGMAPLDLYQSWHCYQLIYQPAKQTQTSVKSYTKLVLTFNAPIATIVVCFVVCWYV